MSKGTDRMHRASKEFAERFRASEEYWMSRVFIADAKRLREESKEMSRIFAADARRLREATKKMNRLIADVTRRSIRRMDPAYVACLTEKGGKTRSGVSDAERRKRKKEFVRAKLKQAEKAWLSIFGVSLRDGEIQKPKKEERTAYWLVSLGRWIPSKCKAQMVGDILEDCDELRRNGRGEWRVRIHALCEWAGTVITSVPASIADMLTRAWKPSQEGSRSQE